MDVMNFLFDQLSQAFQVLFVDFQLPIGISLGYFLIGLLIIHFVISKILPFLKSDKADKTK